MSNNSTHTSLIIGLKERDPTQWTRLCEVYGPLIYYWCRKQGISSADTHDIGQEVFRTVAEKIGEYESHTFRGWLYTITRFKIGDWIRKQNKQEAGRGGTTAMSMLAETPTPLPETETSECIAETKPELVRRMVESVRHEFQEITWQAFWLATTQDRTTADVAAELNMRPATVRNAKYKVLKRLRELFGDMSRLF